MADDFSPKVTGLSPAEGSPGTKVTIRGENFGTGQNDLVSVSICGMDCTMFSEWKSSHKIVTRTRICSGTGDVIVTTKSGGKGTCTVQFRGIHETVSPTVESAVWVDEAHLFHTPFPSMKGPTSSSSLSKELNLLGGADQKALSPKHEAIIKAHFKDKSTDVFASNFSPDLYLLSNHMSSGFENLKSGLKELERRVGAQQEGPSTFLKSNVYGIVKCLDVLKELNRLMNRDRTEMGASLTEGLSRDLKKTLDEASSIFEAILRRKESSDSMRTSLAILQKFRFLFNLPAQIENNVKMGDYDTVIGDYSRARLVFHASEVGIFKRVLSDVEEKIAVFKEKLHQGIREFPAPLNERKKLISYLVQLDPERNPGREAIEYNHKWLLQQMEELKTRHVQRAQTLDDSQDPPQVDFVLSLSRFFCTNAPDFFKLQHAYLHREIEGIQLATFEEEKMRSRDMTLKLVSTLCLEVRAALLPTLSLKPTAAWPATRQPIGPWLPTCLRSVRTCYSCVLKLDPQQASPRMQGLITDLREHAMTSLFNQAAHDIGKLHEVETWRTSSCDGAGGSSQLPLLFENRIIEALQVIQENVLQASASQMFQQATVKAAINQNVQLVMSSYVDCLEKSPEHEKVSRESIERGMGLGLEDKLLITLANIAVSKEQVLPRIQSAFINHQYPDISEIIANGDQLLTQLDQRVLQRVIGLLQRTLVDSVEDLMEQYKVEWTAQRMPTDVSTYVKELLLELIETQQRIYRISPYLVERVLPPIVASLFAEVARLCAHIKTSSQGNLQILIDILALEDSLHSFNRNNSFEILRPCKDRLGGAVKANREMIDDVVQQFKFNQRLQLMCFQ